MNTIYYNSINAMMMEADAFQQQHQQPATAQANTALNTSGGYSCDEHHAAMVRAMAAHAPQDAPPAFHEVVTASAPPAYSRQARRSDESNAYNEQRHSGVPSVVVDAKPVAITSTTAEDAARDINMPPVLLELCVGHKLAAKMTQKRTQRRAARLEEVHDAWTALGLDTRALVATNGKLPPHFWNPPMCTAEEWSRRMNECF